MMADKKQTEHIIPVNKVFVSPEFRKEPDVGKLVRAAITVVEKMPKECTDKQVQPKVGKGDAVP